MPAWLEARLGPLRASSSAFSWIYGGQSPCHQRDLSSNNVTVEKESLFCAKEKEIIRSDKEGRIHRLHRVNNVTVC
jgi:hypothetical protein